MIFTLKDFKIKAAETKLSFSEDFLINNSTPIVQNNSPYNNSDKDLYNSHFNINISKNSPTDIAYLQNLYVHEQLLFYFRNDVPTNREEILTLNYQFRYEHHQNMEELFLINNHLDFEQFNYNYLSMWLNNFSLNETPLQFFKRLTFMPSKEEYYTHLATKEIICNIVQSCWAMGCEKTHLSDYERELIKKYSVLTDLSLIQIMLRYYPYRWVYSKEAGFNQLKSFLNKRFNYITKSYYNLIAQI